MQRQGRKYLASTPNAPQTELKRDQCVLLKRYMLRRRLRVLRKVVAGAGYHRLPDSGDARRSSGEEGVLAREVEDSDEESTSELYGEGEVSDPLDILLDYILEVCLHDRSLHRTKREVFGSLCIEDVISHERDRALAHRIISSSDLAEWADITLDGAGHLEDGHVFINPTGEGDRPFKLKRLAFSDSRRPTRDCQCSAVSTDDKLLAASFGSNDVLVWRLSDGLLVQRLHYQGHTDETTSLSFSPDNSTIASGSGDGAVIVWNVRRGRVLLRPEGHEGAVKSIVYAPHGGLIATCSFSPDYSARISDSSTGARLHTFHVGQRILDIAFSPDGSRFHITLENSRRIYDIQTYTHIATLAHPAMSPIYSSISCQGDRVATVSDDGQVKIWNAATGRELLAITHPKALSHSVSFSPDGVEVVAASPDSTEAVAAFLDDAAKPVEATHDTPRTAMAYDSRTGQLRRVYSLSDGAYKSSGSVSCVAYSPNGDYVVLGTTYGPFQVCDAKSGTPLAKFEEKGRRGTSRRLDFYLTVTLF
ncbi:uncharacterized protein PHACADRAFT_130967 [Phanerochaete carnosa HHB-10118-sp]|uniref:Uncharacterized protein n=1 Tax=Phanerochaete carnosa (strain HHB-10118-sp) TaxID=650164 RepID=K5WJ65_PHACS|nr:uncharacterized protein PHACADRAFT_130967 [Phanerochaete carnosa HHB-10118-sp]EKM50282.1 hypothetical protein PHACADRAFT_130967 [Phanerochaete carnosa HHB-10118-sp]